jgi:predicted O-methyltransferase YrrM
MRLPLPRKLREASRPIVRRLRARWHTLRGRREEGVVHLARCVDGWYNGDEVRLLYRTACHAEGPGHVAEVGCWKGRSTVVLGMAVRDAGLAGCRIYAVDHHRGSEEHREMVVRDGSSLEAFRRNVSRLGVTGIVQEMVMPSDEAARRLADASVHLRLLHIDGAHDEEAVRSDLRHFLPLMSAHGIIALHDCEPAGPFPGVWRAYQSELAARVEVMGRASRLLVVRQIS